MTGKWRAADRWVAGLGMAAGVALGVIGVRFLIVPQHAANFFGLTNPPGRFDLHLMVALRDLWLAGMLVALAVMREWRPLAICLGLGAAVCLGDAAIVAGSSGRTSAVAFHLASGVYCGVLCWAAWRRAEMPG